MEHQKTSRVRVSELMFAYAGLIESARELLDQMYDYKKASKSDVVTVITNLERSIERSRNAIADFVKHDDFSMTV